MVAHDKRKRREKSWWGIIIHHTDIGGRKKVSDSKWRQLYKNIAVFLSEKDDVYASAHYIISRKGEWEMLVDPETHEAFHAGRSSYYHPGYRSWRTDWNRYAIGIELVGDGNLHGYSEEQYEALARLCAKLMDTYRTIDPRCITGHENIAPIRKKDPGFLFNWRYFFDLMFTYVS